MSNDMVMRHDLRCELSGLSVGNLEVRITAGTLPYLTHWNHCVVRHPVFSMGTHQLLKFAKDEWERLAKRAGDEDLTLNETNILCVSYLAVLHSLECIRQDMPALPPIHIVHSTFSRLFNLAWWKHYLESERFRFPTLHIAKYNDNANFWQIGDFLELCFDIRKDYNTKKHELHEQAKIEAAERAVKALNSIWVTPVSKKMLWSWVRAHLPSQFQPDAEGWLGTIFLGNSKTINDFDEEDVDLAEEIIVSSCPGGTGMMHAVRERLNLIKRTWEQEHKAFEIEISDYAEGANLYVNGEKIAAPDPGPIPLEKDFIKRAHFLVAHAKWYIAKQAFEKGQKE